MDYEMPSYRRALASYRQAKTTPDNEVWDRPAVKKAAETLRIFPESYRDFFSVSSDVPAVFRSGVDVHWDQESAVDESPIAARISQIEKKVASELRLMREEVRNIAGAVRDLSGSSLENLQLECVEELPATENLSSSEIVAGLEAIGEVARVENAAWAAIARKALSNESAELRSVAALAIPSLFQKDAASVILEKQRLSENNKYVLSCIDGALYEVRK